MKNFLFFLLLIVVNAKAQTADEVDNKIKLYPKSFSSTDRLAARINADFSTEFSRARAIYTWIALNISYDTEKYLRNNPLVYTEGQEEQINNQIIKEVLLKRMAICDGYSRLFKRLATLVGLESEIITGWGKTDPSEIGVPFSGTNHAWNSVKFDGEWHLIDVTWGSGSYNESTKKFEKEFTSFYFKTPPHLFFLRHYPENGMWLKEKINKERFVLNPLFYSDNFAVDYEMIEPTNGRIVVNKNQKVKFKIKNATTETSIIYSTKSEFSQEVTQLKVVGDAVEFELIIDDTFDKYMTIFIDSKAFVTYKILFKN